MSSAIQCFAIPGPRDTSGASWKAHVKRLTCTRNRTDGFQHLPAARRLRTLEKTDPIDGYCGFRLLNTSRMSRPYSRSLRRESRALLTPSRSESTFQTIFTCLPTAIRRRKSDSSRWGRSASHRSRSQLFPDKASQRYGPWITTFRRFLSAPPSPPAQISSFMSLCYQCRQCGNAPASQLSVRDPCRFHSLSPRRFCRRRKSTRSSLPQRAHRFPVPTFQHLAVFLQRLPVKLKYLIGRSRRHKAGHLQVEMKAIQYNSQIRGRRITVLLPERCRTGIHG